ncbi:MAG: DUF362 domain-containing protein [Deltaproteobacteria bacterium]|nr:DUF362 domain-containing protein [Deltaproteobacteria bacterium]MBW1978545.1 DUF362 domain-containing protein [Deltaproteobacteria bacterium]MBW2044859.1 DUF362 domain-containing protein [Deltaproteobacteria bacterium]
MSKAKVSLIKTRRNPGYAEIYEAVRQALDLIGGIRDVVKPGDLVLINPSWVAPPVEREAGCITIPEVPRALADIVRDLGARPVIAESSAVGVDTEKVIESSGYRDLREMGYEVINLKKTPYVDIPTENGKIFETVECWELVQQADVIISVPKLKTHDQTEMTCAIKNLKGLLTDKWKRLEHQEGLFDSVIDLLSAVKPKLAVVDAIICQEGIGPVFGKPVEMDLVLAGKDLVAVDSTCAQLIGYDPSETLLTVNAAARGLGLMDPEQIEILGEHLEKVKRRFLRAIEDDPVQVEDFHLIHGEATCTGCRNTVMSALVDMRNADQLEYLSGIWVLTGGAPPPEGVPRDSIVTVGKCMPKEIRTERHVKGCPPNNAYVVKAIIGDRAKVKRMYAEDTLDKTDS